jgi:putative nucleotidyltransferase with HDIG domain
VTKALGRLLRVNGGLLVLLGIVLATGAVNFAVIDQRAVLNLYYLPVVLGAYLLGRRRGVFAGILSCTIVFGMALMNDRQFAGHGIGGMQRWLDLGTWACVLLLTAYVVGTLYEERAEQVRDLEDAYHGILEILPRLIDAVDHQTENHSRRVADYAVEVARTLGLAETEVEDVRVGALLHDIGKVDISAEVLRKAAALTPGELAEMQRHVETGERMVRSMGGILRHVIPMVAFHHERWDGMGYKGLKAENIPIGARIIAVADTYDAIVCDRPYRKGRTCEEALHILREGSGRQFDPRVVGVFLDLYDPAAAEPGAERAA